MWKRSVILIIVLGCLDGAKYFSDHDWKSDCAEKPRAHTDTHSDSLPAGALTRMGTARLHNAKRVFGEVLFLAYSPEGKSLATLGSGQPVRLWDVRTGKCLSQLPQPKMRELQGHGMGEELSFSPDGLQLYSTWRETWPHQQFIGSWDINKASAFQPFYHTTDSIDSVNVSPNGKLMALAVCPQPAKTIQIKIKVWDFAHGRVRELCKYTSRRLATPPAKVVFAPNGKLLAISDDTTINLLDIATGMGVQRFQGHEYPVAFTSFSSDGKLLASCEGSARTMGSRTREMILHRVIRLWDVATGKSLLTIDCRDGDFCAVYFSPDGRMLVSGNRDGPIRLWEVGSGNELLRLEDGANGLRALALAPDGQTVASGHVDGTALIWSLAPASWMVPTDALGSERLKSLWANLASGEGPQAYGAVWTLSSRPAETLAFLRERLRPVAAEKPERIRQLVASLDDSSFKRRTAASEELARLGPQAEDALRHALADSPSPELRLRAEPLLKAVDGWVIKDPEQLRIVRAIWVLQRIGSPEARALLEKLAAGAPAVRQTQEAKAALQYLDRSKKR